MADNFATALKNLNKELNEADVKIRAAQGDSQALFNAIVRGVGISKDAFRSLVSELSGTNIKGARTIDIVTRLVDENGKKLTPESIKNTIENITKNSKTQTLGLFQYHTSDLNTLKKMLAMSKKDAADLLSTVLKISNASVGLNKTQGTAYSNALASRIKEEARARNKIIKLQERQLQLEQAIDRASSNKSGKTKFEGQMRSVADLNKELAKTARLISQQNAILQGSGRGQNVAKALGLGTAKKEADMLNNSLSKTIGLANRLGNAFGIVFSAQGLVQFGRKMVETRGEFELQQVAMRSILQNKQLADEIWDKTMQQALQSPFTAMQLTKYTKQLAAYRIETEKLFDTTKMLADVSAGLGVDMQRLILAYGQVKAANYLRASEIRQFTEAGVNILGELSKYFSDTREGIYSTAKVMDMVQKRLVTFADVEAIFKRLTSESGIFYNMQYIQSQTVKGQIAKLHDAYDQMLNSIGKANNGTIRTFVGLLNGIVKNWREWKTVLDSVAIPALIISLKRFTQGLFAANAATIATDKSFKLLTRTGAKLNVRLKELFTTLKANPWMALAAVIGTATIAIWNHFKAVKAINDNYDELMLRSYETQKSMNGYIETIERNVDVMKNNTKNTEEYTAANKENEGIIARLKNDYPELLEGMDEQNIQYDQLIGRIKLYNDELDDRIRLEYMARASFGRDDLQTNISQLQEDYRQREMDFLENRLLAEKKYIQLKSEGRESDENSWEKQIRLAKNYQEQIDIIERQNESISGGGDYSLQAKGYKKPGGSIFKSVEGRENDLRQNIERESLIYNDIIREQLQTINNDLGDDIEQFISENRKQVNELFKNQEGAGWKLLNDRIVTFFTAKGAEDKETRDIIERQLNQMLLVPIKLDWNKSTRSSNNNVNSEENGNNSKNYKSISSLISLLKEMNSEYDKLSKSAYGFAKSNEKVRESFKDAFEEIFKFAGINIDQVDITSKLSTANAMKLVLDTLDNKNLWVQFGKDGGKKARQEFLKSFGQMKAEVDIQISEQTRADFGLQMEEMFGDYELTLELQNLGISEDMARDLFPDLDYTSIGKLQGIMKDFYDSRQKKDEKGNVLFSVTDLEEYRKWADKIDSEILKARKEKVKQYSKYLEKEYSERAKLEMKHAQDIAFVTANITDEAQRKNIIENINRKYKNDLNDLNWRSFKESDFYVEMMDDISSLPREYMQMMLDKIEEILQHPETLSPRALKEAINARQKVLEAQMNLEPLDVMRSSLTTIREAQQDKDVGGKNWKQTKENINKAVAEQAELIKGYDNEIQRLQTLQGELAGYEKALENLQKADSNVDIPLLNRVLGLDENGKITSMVDMSDFAIQEAIDRLTTENTQERAKYDATVQTDEMNARAVEISDKERLIKLLTDELTARRELSNYQMSDDAKADVATGQTSTSVSSDIQEVQGKKDTSVKKIQNFKKYLKAFTQFDAAFEKFNAAINSTLNAVASMGNAFYDMFDALGGETNVLTEGWKEFGNTIISSISNALTMIPMMVAAFTEAGIAINSALGIIGIIAQAMTVLITVITAISKLHDAGVDYEIEKHQEKLDDLIESYEDLDDAIKGAMSSAQYISDYDAAVQNLNQQIEEANAQIAAAQDYKNDDKREEAIENAEDAIEDAKDKLKDLKKDMQDTFLGFNTDDFRSMTEDFVSAWLDAYEETGDGFDAMMDNFEETMKKWFIKQAVMRLAGAKMETLLNQMVAAIDEDGNGGVAANREEIEAIRERAALLFAGLNDDLKELYSIWGLGSDDTLSGLAAGIQGMTEEQANVLEAYWNSVRQMTASIDSNVASIALILGAGGVNTNPMLTHLQTIADNTSYIQSIYELLAPLQTNGGNGRGFRTYQM